MKKAILTFLTCIATLLAQAQVVDVKSVEQIPVDIKVNTPCISPDGTFAIVSTINDQSLQRVDLTTGATTLVTENGQTRNLAFTPDGETIIFRRSTTRPNRLRYHSILSLNLNNGASARLTQPVRNGGDFTMTRDGNLTVTSEGKITRRNLRGEEIKAQSSYTVGINRGHLVVTAPDGTSVNLDPQGKGSYLWPVLSPDGTKIAYYFSGVGCFVCNVDGSDIHKLGYVHAPVWLNNDIIIGQQDYDNGEVYTSSTIIAATLDGTIQKLTDENLIGMNPSVNADGSRILFATADGKLYVINLK